MNLKEYIITEGEFLEEVIFVRRGHLTIHLGSNYNEHKLMEIRKNEHFGDILVLSNLRSPVTIKVASKICDLLIIKKQDLLEIAADFPESIEEIFLVSSFNYSSLIEIIEAQKLKLDAENQKLKERKLEYLKYLKANQNSTPSLVENINTFVENKRVVDNLNKRIESEELIQKNDFEKSAGILLNNYMKTNNNGIQANYANKNSLKYINKNNGKYSINNYDTKNIDNNVDNRFDILNVNNTDFFYSYDNLDDYFLSRPDIYADNRKRHSVSFCKSLIKKQNFKSDENNINYLLEDGLQPLNKSSLSDARMSAKNISCSQGNIRRIFEFSSEAPLANINLNKKKIINSDKNIKQEINKSYCENNFRQHEKSCLISNDLLKPSTDTSSIAFNNTHEKYLNNRNLKKNENFAFIYNKLKSENQLNETFNPAAANHDYSLDIKNDFNPENFVINKKLKEEEDMLKENKNSSENMMKRNSIGTEKNSTWEILKKSSEKLVNNESPYNVPEENLIDKDNDIAALQNASKALKYDGSKLYRKNNFYLDEQKIIRKKKVDFTDNNDFNDNDDNKLYDYLISSDMAAKKEFEDRTLQINRFTSLKRINNNPENHSGEKQIKSSPELNYYNFQPEKNINDESLESEDIQSKSIKNSNYSSSLSNNLGVNSFTYKVITDKNLKQEGIGNRFNESNEKVISNFNIEESEQRSSLVNNKNDSKEIKIIVSDDRIGNYINYNNKEIFKVGNEIDNKQRSEFFISKSNKKYKLKDSADYLNNLNLKRRKTNKSKSLEPVYKTNNKAKILGDSNHNLNESASSGNSSSSSEAIKQKTFIFTNNSNNSININIKCNNCDHIITLERDMLFQLWNGNVENLNFVCVENNNKKDKSKTSASIEENENISLNNKQSKKETNVKNIYNIYNNCNINHTIEAARMNSKIAEKENSESNKEENYSNKDNKKSSSKHKNNNRNSNKNEVTTLKSKYDFSKLVQPEYAKNESERNAIIKYKNHKNFDLDLSQQFIIKEQRKSLSEEFKSQKQIISKNINQNEQFESSKNKLLIHNDYLLSDKLNSSIFINNASAGNIINSYREGKLHNEKENNIKNLINSNIARCKKSRNNNNNLLISIDSPSPSGNKNRISIKRNRIKENLKNVRNRLRNKDSLKFRKSTEIVDNIYNSIFFRNKVLNNPDEFYFNEFKVLFRTGLEEEVKKESVKINNIIIKILKLNRFNDNFTYDEKKNFVELKKINPKISEDLDYKLDIPFIDAEK